MADDPSSTDLVAATRQDGRDVPVRDIHRLKYGVDGLLNSNAARCVRGIGRAMKCRTTVFLAAAGEPHGATASQRVLD